MLRDVVILFEPFGRRLWRLDAKLVILLVQRVLCHHQLNLLDLLILPHFLCVLVRRVTNRLLKGFSFLLVGLFDCLFFERSSLDLFEIFDVLDVLH